MSVTQKDIARAAGVSQTIVSDVLQDRPRGRVSAETRTRILETARLLDYRPNALAQALRSRQSRQVVYLTTQAEVDRQGGLGEQIISGLARALGEEQYRLFFEVVSGPEREVPTLRELIAAGICDAAVIRAIGDQEEVWPLLHDLEHPCAVIGQCPDPLLTSVAHDVPGMIRAALRHLTGRGHRRVALIANPPRSVYHRLIWSAWRAEAPSLGLDPERWTQEDGGRQVIAAQVARWLELPEPPTAVIAVDPVATVGAMDAALVSGRRVGAELDLVAIGPGSDAWLYAPGTWYFGTDQAAVGRRAAAELARQLAGLPPAGPVRILPELLQRREGSL